MSELRDECYKCLNNRNCFGGAEYGSLYCMMNRRLNVQSEEDSVYAIKFAAMQKQIDERDKKIKKLEKENKHKDTYIKMAKEVIENSILKDKIKDLKESIKLEPVIVGGRRNRKTLEYGIKLGKIKACEELLEENK